MQSFDEYNHYAKIYFVLCPEHLTLGEEWCKEFVKLQLQEGYLRALDQLEKEWPKIVEKTALPPLSKNGLGG